MPVRGVTGYLLSQQHPHEVGEALLPQEAGDMVGDHDRRLDLAAAEAMQIGGHGIEGDGAAEDLVERAVPLGLRSSVAPPLVDLFGLSHPQRHGEPGQPCGGRFDNGRWQSLALWFGAGVAFGVVHRLAIQQAHKRPR